MLLREGLRVLQIEDTFWAFGWLGRCSTSHLFIYLLDPMHMTLLILDCIFRLVGVLVCRNVMVATESDGGQQRDFAMPVLVGAKPTGLGSR